MLHDADFQIVPDTDYNHGATGPSVPATSPQDCCAACVAYDSCVAGVFFSNTCWLKTEADVAKQEAMPGRTACRFASVRSLAVSRLALYFTRATLCLAVWATRPSASSKSMLESQVGAYGFVG